MSKSLSRHHHPPGLTILYEDRHILVVDKKPGLLTVEAGKPGERTAYRQLTTYVRKGCLRSRERIFIVHRLDRDTSGVLVFARTETVKRTLQDQWKDTRKRYLAVVHGTPAKPEGTLISYLAENSAHRVYETHDPAKGQLAQTAWRCVKSAHGFSLLEIDLATGRKNQIRVQLAGFGHPIVGDSKYGRTDDPVKKLALHAHSIAITHPVTRKRVVFTTPVPGRFTRWVGKTLPPPVEPPPPENT